MEAEESYKHSELVLLDVADERGGRVVGRMGLMRASSSPFVFEQVFPEVGERIDRRVFRGRVGLGREREEIVEGASGYVEKEHRRKHLALLLWAGFMLVAEERGYPIVVGMGHPSTTTAMGDAFHPLGLTTDLAGVRYELGLLFPDEIAPRMIDGDSGAWVSGVACSCAFVDPALLSVWRPRRISRLYRSESTERC